MLLTRVARPLLAAWFIAEGVGAARNPQSHVELARGPVNNVVESLGGEPLTDAQLRNVVRVEGVATVFLALGLGFSKTPRTCGLLLAAASVPHVVATAPVGPSAQSRGERMGVFAQKLGALGAALLVAGDTGGKPSMAYRVNKAKKQRAQNILEGKAAAGKMAKAARS